MLPPFARRQSLNHIENTSIPTGESVSFTYNPLDGSRKTATRTMPGGTSVTTTYAYYGYDANGNPTPDFRQGQLASVTTQASGGPSRTISYNYDLLGNKSSMTTPGGKTVGYGYDVLNRLSIVTHPDGATTTFGYDKVGNRQSVTRATSTGMVFSTTGYSYDSLNRLTDIINKNASSAVVSSYHYTLRLDGKRGSVTEGGPATSGGTTGYFYDDSGKLTEEAGPYADIKYGYDNVGNRLTRTVTGAATGNGTTLTNGITNTAYDVNDRIVGHSYDADGNETTVNGQAAGYDFENHLVSLGNGVANYVYDADGNRVSVSSAGTTTSYAVDTSLPYASVVEEYAGTSATPSARYDYGDDLVRMDRGGVYYYLYDGLGSTRQLVNTSGAVTDSYGYSAFGEMASHTGTTANPFLFNAQQFDGASGDYYLRARYYDQTSGRFISQDPYSGSDDDPVTLHRYLYTGDDPVDRIDPSGCDTESDDVEARIQSQYLTDHPGRLTTKISFGQIKQQVGQQFFDSNGWIPIQKYNGSTSTKLKNSCYPDIFDFNADAFTFNEIKPFSISGVIEGVAQLGKYIDAFSPSNSDAPNGFRPDAMWEPSVLPIVTSSGTKYVVFNVAGILFYLSYKNAADLARSARVANRLITRFAARAASSGEVAEVLEEETPALVEESQVSPAITSSINFISGLNSFETAEITEETGEATILGEMGAP